MCIEINGGNQWLRANTTYGGNVMLSTAFGVFAKGKVVSDRNTKCPVILLTNNTDVQVGLYTDDDGLSLKMAIPWDDSEDSAAHPSSLVVGSYLGLGIVGYLDGPTPKLRAYVGGATLDVPHSAFTVEGIWMGTETINGEFANIKWADWLITKFAPNAAQVAQIFARPDPWALFDPSMVYGYAPCRGPNLDAMLAAMTPYPYLGMSNEQGTADTDDPVYGPTAGVSVVSGYAVLPLGA